MFHYSILRSHCIGNKSYSLAMFRQGVFMANGKWDCRSAECSRKSVFTGGASHNIRNSHELRTQSRIILPNNYLPLCVSRHTFSLPLTSLYRRIMKFDLTLNSQFALEPRDHLQAVSLLRPNTQLQHIYMQFISN